MFRRTVVASAVLATALGLSACSSSSSSSGPLIDSSMSASQIATAAGSALASVSILKLTGTVPSSGFQGPLVMSMNRNGEFNLSLTKQATDPAPSVQMIKSGSTIYLNIAPSYLQSQVPALAKVPLAVRTATINALSSKWLIVPKSGAFASLGKIALVAKSLDLFNLAAQISHIPSGATVGSTGTVNGIEVVPISAGGTTIDVATATALPVQLSQAGASNSFTMSYPTSSTIPPPSGAVTVSVALGAALSAALAGIA